uniref:CUB domain-containing protein n=1 Tax=Panagrellus redivivus TaxID=6233 RepID=A0A7E4UVL8_PANRE
MIPRQKWPVINIRFCHVFSPNVYPTMQFCYYSKNRTIPSTCNQACGFEIEFGRDSVTVNTDGKKYAGLFVEREKESCFVLQQRQYETIMQMHLLTDDYMELQKFNSCGIWRRDNRVIMGYDEILMWASVSSTEAQMNLWVEGGMLIGKGVEKVLETTTEAVETTESVMLTNGNDVAASAGFLNPLNIGVIIVAAGIAVSVVLFCTMYWIHRHSNHAPPVTKPQIIRSITAGSQDANKTVPKQPSQSASKKDLQQKSSKSTKQRSSDARKSRLSDPTPAKQTSSNKKPVRKTVKSIKERQKAPSTTIMPPPRNKSIFSRLHKRETAPRPPPKATGFIQGQEFLSNDESTMPTVTPQMATPPPPIIPSKEAMTAIPKTSADTVTAGQTK